MMFLRSRVRVFKSNAPVHQRTEAGPHKVTGAAPPLQIGCTVPYPAMFSVHVRRLGDDILDWDSFDRLVVGHDPAPLGV
jgi:hypothetical protein